MTDRSPRRGNTLVSHPHRRWYDDKIIEGLPINHIYSQQTLGNIPPELHVSKRTIAEYRNNILRPHSEIVKQFKEERKKEEQEIIHQELISSPHIATAIEEKKTEMINADQTFLDLHMHMKSQIQKLASIDDEKTRAKIDVASAIGNLCDQMRLLTMDFLKLQGQLRETPQTQINIINIEKNNAEIDALKTTIVDIISEIDPSILPRFFQLLKERLDPVSKAYELRQLNMANEPSIDEGQATKAVQQFIQKAEQIKNGNDDEF